MRQNMALPRHFAAPPPPPQPYYSYPTPESALPNSSVESTPVFGAAPMMTPASTSSPQSTWQSPQPDVLPSGDMGQWSEFNFDDLQAHHPPPPTSDPMTTSHAQQGGADLGGMSFGASTGCTFAADGEDGQGFSAFSHMPEFGFEGEDGLQGVLQRQLDECAPLPVY